jgi:hypothetical protein
MRSFDEFKVSLEAHRNLGSVTVGRIEDTSGAPSAQPAVAADYALARFGLSGIGVGWKRLDRPAALAQIAGHLNRSLAYGVEMLSPAAAEAMATAFLSFFPAPEAVFLTNASPRPADGSGWGWDPVSASTFDVCFVAIGEGSVAFIVLEDED